MNNTKFIALFAFVLSACSPLPRQAEHLAALQSCCKNASEFQFTNLETSKSAAMNITESSLAFDFDEGKSYFAAVHLPARDGLRKLMIKTQRTGLLVDDSQIFCPMVTYYDNQFANVGVTGDLSLFYEPPGLIVSGYWYSVADVPTNAEYAVIHTSAKTIGRPITLSGDSPGYVFYNGRAYVYVPGGASSQTYPCGQTGELEVEVKG